MTTQQSNRFVYVWELPVRIFHILNGISVLVLIGTGYVIGNPPALLSGQEANSQYWFGIVRFIHFVAAYIFLFNFLFRIYFGFKGNRYARWENFIPLKNKQWKEILKVIRVDLLLMVGEPIRSIGHNSLASLIYFIYFLLSVFQIVTGLGMMAPMSDGFIADWFSWIVILMDGDATVRFWHHVNTWVFILFIIVHVYLAIIACNASFRGVCVRHLCS